MSNFAAGSEAARPVRVIDTGIRGSRENVAVDQALIEAHNAARVPQTVRFLRFRPSAGRRVAHARNYVRRH